MKRENSFEGRKAQELIRYIDEQIGESEISEEIIETEGKALYEISKIFSAIEI